MAWQIFATKTSPTAMSTLDTQFNNVAQWSQIDTTATGTNAITLAPSLSGYTAAAYANYVSYRFVAAATSSGAITLRVSALAFLNVYGADLTTQMTTGNIVIGRAYLVTYNSALNGGAGGWLLTPLGASTGGVSNPVVIGEGGTGQVTAAAARGSSGLNIANAVSTSFNADSSIAATTHAVQSSTTAMTGGHTLTLPAANAVIAGEPLYVEDLCGVVGAQTLTIQRAGADTVNGTTSVALATQYAAWMFQSDGTSKWSAHYIPPASTSGVAAGDGITVVGSTVSLNTNNSMGIGSSAQLLASSTVADGATTAGSGLASGRWTAAGSAPTFDSGTSQSGTWRNVSGVASGNGAVVTWIRTA